LDIKDDSHITPEHVAMYVAHMHRQKLSANSIKTHLSAISFSLKAAGLHNLTDTFTVQKLLLSYSKIDPPPKVRKPITEKILHQLVKSLKHNTKEKYNKYLFIAIFTIMYHAALRVSEVSRTPGTSHTLQNNQILSIQFGKGKALKIKLSSYKHCNSNKTALILSQTSNLTCPVKAYANYLTVRPKSSGPAFRHKSGKPITRNQILSSLHQHLTLSGHNKAHYNTHSFRIGKTTDLANKGYTHAQIALIGRWHSNAYTKYIKPSTVLCS